MRAKTEEVEIEVDDEELVKVIEEMETENATEIETKLSKEVRTKKLGRREQKKVKVGKRGKEEENFQKVFDELRRCRALSRPGGRCAKTCDE